MNRARVFFGSSLLLAFAGSACAGSESTHIPSTPLVTPAEQIPRVDSNPAFDVFVLSVLGLNDLHGHIETLPLFSGYVKNLRAELEGRGEVVVVDAGDMFQGTMASNLNEGAALIRAYAALVMTAVALGNHEFDHGPVGEDAAWDGRSDPQGAIKQRLLEAPFPMLAANLVERETRELVRWQGLSPTALVTIQGVKVGFVGVITEGTPRIVMPAYFAGLDVAPLQPAIEQHARALRKQGADVVIAIAHAGARCENFDNPQNLSSCDGGEIFPVLKRLPPGLVDLVVAGHTHAGVAHFFNGIAVIEAYAYGRAFSRADIRFERNLDGVYSVTPFPPHPLCPNELEARAPTDTNRCPTNARYAGRPVVPDPVVADAIAPALELARQRGAETLGVTISHAFSPEHGAESALGNLFADLMLEAVPGADLALLNGGSLRASLDAGPLSYGALFEAMPFDNVLVEIQLSAGALRKVFSRHFKAGRHGIVSVAGIRVAARCAADGKLTVTLIDRKGRDIPDGRALRVVTSDYLATGGDTLFVPLGDLSSRTRSSGVLMREALASGLRALRGSLSALDKRYFDPDKPRLALTSPRPIQCRP